MGLVAVAIVACCVVLALSHQALLVVGVQVLLTLLVVAVSIPVLRRLHDAVPSSIRAGVASGVGTLTWLTFVPFALAFGAVSERAGVNRAGWLLVAIGVVAAVLIIVVLPRSPAPLGEAAPVVPAPAQEMEPIFPVDRFLPPDDPEWPGHWAYPPSSWDALSVSVDGAEALEQARAAIAEMPPALRQSDRPSRRPRSDAECGATIAGSSPRGGASLAPAGSGPRSLAAGALLRGERKR